MTEQPQRTQLSPEEWKQLCVLNCKQLFDHLNSIPAMIRADENSPVVSGMTAEQIAAIETHLARGSQFLNAWARSKPLVTAQPGGADLKEVAQAANGAAAPKKRGGWPKGKPRVSKAANQDAA